MVDNVVVQENARLDGRTSQTYWDVPHTTQIEGFATDISSNVGEQVDFKINVNGGAGGDYLVEIFRLGYYGGEGARKVGEWVNSDATVQPDAQYDAARGLVDAGNWSVTDSWEIPEDAVSGIYLARLQRLDAEGNPIEGAVNQIPFIVRDDDRPADIVLQTSDTTWHAYNGWFGNNGQIGANFYGDASGTIDHPDIPGAGVFAQDRAYAVSYNRPFITRGIEGQQGGPAAGAQDYLFGADYAAVQWLEQNGYDVSYISGVDTDRLGADYLTKYGAFISVGHDEYWSGDQRYNVEAARDAGVNLLFWGGNDIYWKTRWDVSIVDGVEYRTLVCYKETWAHGDANASPEDYYNLDPTNTWTGTWRDDRFIGNPLAGDDMDRPPLTGQPHLCNCAENSLTGQLFGPDGTGEFGGALDVPEEYAPLRVWRDTSVADGGALDMSPGILGYEWNTTPDDDYTPAGLIKLSETTIPWSRILVDQGNTTLPGVATHNLTLYRAESGALVFGAGTVFWTWALSNVHDSEPYGGNIENLDLQQFVVNLFADMGIQPGVADAVLASQGLVRALASTDTVAATATIADLPDTIGALQTVTITGTATDNDGNPLSDDGIVALVEVSFDGGVNWSAATGRATWSFTWTPTVQGTYTILVRAIDDSLNTPLTVSLDSEVVEVGAPIPPETISLFSPFVPFAGTTNNDATPVELGTRFIASEGGLVTELKYYRHESDAGDADVRAGHLWDAAGNLLATVQFTSTVGESGWQVATLDTPISLQAGTEYVVSYKTLDNYVSTVAFFGESFVEPYGILAAPGGGSGVYAYGAGLAFPNGTYGGSNYWVDVTFAPVENQAPAFTSMASVSVAEGTLAAAALAATDPDRDSLTFAIAGGADAGAFRINPATGALSFVMAPDFEAPADANGDNAYELIVSVTDEINAPVERALTISVTDVVEEGGALYSNLYGPGDTPASTSINDPTDYELGTRFQASQAGVVTELRYYRGAADAGDTDTRTLNLWDAAGNNLGSVTVVSAQGQSGWQTGVLDAAIAITAGSTYVVSYGTVQNYVYTAGFFTNTWTGADGVLTGPAGGNGVFSQGSTGLFPTQSYNSSNYWVDISFEAADPPANHAPAFGGPFAFALLENQASVATVAAADNDLNTLTFAIAGGADAALFQINAASGALTFLDTPDFEEPGDAGANNVYDLVLSVSDGIAPAVERSFTVSVTDDATEPGAGTSSLFGSAAPATTISNDPSSYELGVKFQATEDGAIAALRYYRGATDAEDTDTRTLNLWDAAGNNLGSVTVQSTAGQSGWQTGDFAAPIAIEADTTYIVSYGTVQNYAFSPSFFGSTWSSSDGMLLAPASGSSGGNGVFSTSPGLFPTQTYNGGNYWADVVFEFDAPSLLATSSDTQADAMLLSSLAAEDTFAFSDESTPETDIFEDATLPGLLDLLNA